jgi:histidyl-tRNA synthetase
MATIEPRNLKGFRDFLPQAAIRRQNVIASIIKTYERFGFVPLETPALEYADVLMGKYGEEGEKLLYRFRDQGDREVALRYDLTVPLARVVAQYPELSKPFRRYQIAPVWRAENTQKGRFREFTQCDIDIVGTSSMLADAEIAQVMAAALANLGFSNFQIRINNRKLLNGILEAARVPENQWLATLRSLDKWGKIRAKGVEEELSGFLSEKITSAFIALLPKETEDFSSWSERTIEMISATTNGVEGIKELNKVMTSLAGIGMPEGTFQGDVLLARGLDYYTGTIFEAALTDTPEIGSVYGGGRYDKLIGQFIGKDIPAVGTSAGVDRILAAMEELGMGIPRSSTADVLVCMMGEELAAETSKLANELRTAGINTETWYEPDKLDKQLKYADKQGIPFVVLFGSDEKEQGMVTVKDLRTKKQEQTRKDFCIQTIQNLLQKEQ